MLARAISSAFITGGGEVRLGEIFRASVGGEDCFVGRVWGGGRGGEELLALGGEEDEAAMGCSGSSNSKSNSEPAGPEAGLRPSRNALAMSAAFHFEYLIFSTDYK